LFRSAIAMSGSPLNAWGFLDMSEAVSRSFSIGNVMGIETTNASLLLEKLYNASADHITLAATFLSTPYVPFLTPTIENSEIAATPIITECTVKKLTTGHFNHVPVIIGFVNVETLSFVGLDTLSRIGLIDGTLAVVQNFSELLETQEIQYLQKIRNKTEGITNLPNGDLYLISNISSDLLFNYGIDRTERFLAAGNTAPVYYYRNSFDYSQSLHKLWGINLNGTSHADDIAHIFWLPNKNQSL
ncbi:Similar to carboxylesterase clade B member 3, partial [Cotesia congregata]